MKCPIPHRKIRVGWVNTAPEAKAIYFPPLPLAIVPDRTNAAAYMCPAIQNACKNIWVIRAPFDIELQVKDGRLQFIKDEKDSSIKYQAFNNLLKLEPPENWRHEDKEILQIVLPYAFASDTPGVVLQILPPFNHYTSWPGLMLSGRFNIYDWPWRNVHFPFEWHDKAKPLVIKRGEPLFYLQILSDKIIELVECENDLQVERMQRELYSITNYVRGTRSIMKWFGQNRRPKQVVFPKGTT